MSQCWGRILVDGAIAQGQASRGTLPFELREGIGRELPASQSSIKSDAGFEPSGQSFEKSTENQNVPQAIPILCGDWSFETHSDHGGGR